MEYGNYRLSSEPLLITKLNLTLIKLLLTISYAQNVYMFGFLRPHLQLTKRKI